MCVREWAEYQVSDQGPGALGCRVAPGHFRQEGEAQVEGFYLPLWAQQSVYEGTGSREIRQPPPACIVDPAWAPSNPPCSAPGEGLQLCIMTPLPGEPVPNNTVPRLPLLFRLT